MQLFQSNERIASEERERERAERERERESRERKRAERKTFRPLDSS